MFLQILARYCGLLLLSIFLVACNTTSKQPTDFEVLYGKPSVKQRFIASDDARTVSYWKDVKPILDSRCVSCHACYDAPCQLKLSSLEGLDRGSSKETIYGDERLKAAPPTRLFIDETNTTDWRNRDFYPVLNEGVDSAEAALHNSLLARLLALKREHPLPKTDKLPDSFKLGLDRELQCPTQDEFAKYKRKHPLWGMPYAMPAISENEQAILEQWLKEGATATARPPLSSETKQQVIQWENFFNGSSLKQQLVSRYIYEHLFIGHIHFKGHPDNEFFALIRSKTPTGQAIEEIKTVRPYENPKVEQFYYRLRPIVSTIVDKIHFVYEFSEQKMLRYQQLFLSADYQVDKLPSYNTDTAANPFTTFIAIPAAKRYQFLLDDAKYFVSGFIKGPVCRGQVALNVIRDQFWIVFTRPNIGYNKSAKGGDGFLTEQSPYLNLPNVAGDDIGLFDWKKYDNLAKTYLHTKETLINQHLLSHSPANIDFFWDGDGHNKNAALTVFRHDDSATVVNGLVGKVPLTAWVVDYPILERIHYLLVAGFNVYGSMGHQIATRFYMDFLREDAENNFLRFIPKNTRIEMYESWHQGIVANLLSPFNNAPLVSNHYETGINYQTTDYKTEFFEQFRKKVGNAVDPLDSLNISQNISQPQNIKQWMQTLSQVKGKQLALLPDLSFIRIKTANPENDPVYSLVVNQRLKNVDIAVAENIRRTPKKDSLTVVEGFIGSYPNFFFHVPEAELAEFIDILKTAKTKSQRNQLYKKYGVRRTNPDIWQAVDWFNQKHQQLRGTEAGLFDMNRYRNL